MPSFVIEDAVPAGGGGTAVAVTVTVAVAYFELSAALVAVTLKFPALDPAVYSPPVETVPPVAVQVTLVFELPVTVAENCCGLPVCTDAELGFIATLTPEFVGGGYVFDPVPTYPAHPPSASVSATTRSPAPAPDQHPPRLSRSALSRNCSTVSEDGMVSTSAAQASLPARALLLAQRTD